MLFFSLKNQPFLEKELSEGFQANMLSLNHKFIEENMNPE